MLELGHISDTIQYEMTHKVKGAGRDSWDEAESVRLLQDAGALVTVFEAKGARMPRRELYHARIIAAHDDQDMAAYRTALHGYVEAARQASRKATRR